MVSTKTYIPNHNGHSVHSQKNSSRQFGEYGTSHKSPPEPIQTMGPSAPGSPYGHHPNTKIGHIGKPGQSAAKPSFSESPVGNSSQAFHSAGQGGQLGVQHHAINGLMSDGFRLKTAVELSNNRGSSTNINKDGQKTMPDPGSVASQPPVLPRIGHHESTGNSRSSTVLHEGTRSSSKPPTTEFRGKSTPLAPPPLNASSSPKANLAEILEKGRNRNDLDRGVPSSQVAERPTRFGRPPEMNRFERLLANLRRQQDSTAPAPRTPEAIPVHFGSKKLAHPSNGKDGESLKKACTQAASKESLRQRNDSIFQELYIMQPPGTAATPRTAGSAKTSIDHALSPAGAPSVPTSGNGKALVAEDRTCGSTTLHKKQHLCPEITLTGPIDGIAKQGYPKVPQAPMTTSIHNADRSPPKGSGDLLEAASVQDHSLAPGIHNQPSGGDSVSFALNAKNSHEERNNAGQIPHIEGKGSQTRSETVEKRVCPGAAAKDQTRRNPVTEPAGVGAHSEANPNSSLNTFEEQPHRSARVPQKRKALRMYSSKKRRCPPKCSGPSAVDPEDGQYLVEELEKFDSTTDRFYLKWKGYDRKENEWVHREDIHQGLIDQYWERVLSVSLQ